MYRVGDADEHIRRSSVSQSCGFAINVERSFIWQKCRTVTSRHGFGNSAGIKWGNGDCNRGKPIRIKEISEQETLDLNKLVEADTNRNRLVKFEVIIEGRSLFMEIDIGACATVIAKLSLNKHSNVYIGNILRKYHWNLVHKIYRWLQMT